MTLTQSQNAITAAKSIIYSLYLRKIGGRNHCQTKRNEWAIIIMMRGTIIKFNRETGIGYLTIDDDLTEVLRFEATNSNGFNVFEVGQRVEFDIIDGQKGPEAENVVLID